MDTQALLNTLRTGHHILGPRECELAAADEIERLQEAKRAALNVADERSKENVKLRERMKHITSWLRAQANSEREPKAKAAFVEAHNAVLGIAEGRHDYEQREPK